MVASAETIEKWCSSTPALIWRRRLVASALAIVSTLCLDVPSPRAQEQARSQGTEARAKPKAVPKDELTLRLELMLRAMRIARGTHVEKPEKPILVRGAIEGLLTSLDAEAEYYTRAQLRALQTRREGVGLGELGLELRREAPGRRRERPGYRIVTVRDGSPAADAGLRADQRVTIIDGVAAGSLSPLDVAWTRLPGLVGSSVQLRIETASDTTNGDVVLQRREPASAGVDVRQLDPGTVYIRISRLDHETAATIERELARLGRISGPPKAAVLDLRSASGGAPQDADAVADAVMASGELGGLKIKSKVSASRNQASPGDVLNGAPLAVLIDAGTAGALESLAAVMKDARRARLVGTRTAGRGAVRSLLPLGHDGDKGALWLATAQMVTSSGLLIEGKGIEPDVTVEQNPGERECRSLDIWSNDLRRCVLRLPQEDAQLQRALTLLVDGRTVAEQRAPEPLRP